MAYQRSCSNRFIPETDKWVDKICDLIGVDRVAREYDRENALCCTGPFATLGKKRLIRETQNKNINDMLEYGAEVCVYTCPFCIEMMGSKVQRRGLKNYLLSDLCRLALNEALDY
jgi:Fe-S oxidoreductase